MDDDELQNVINQNNTIKDSTKKQYKNAYARWTDTTDRQVTDSSEAYIIQVLERIACSPNSKNTTVSAIVMIRNFHELSVDKIRRWRDTKLKKRIDVAHTAKDKSDNELLPTYTELMDHVKKLYKDKNYKDYIINFILSKYCVRNRDLNCFITQDKSMLLQTDTNIIYLAPSYAIYQRNDYKTHPTYGEIKINIRSMPFRNACLNFLDDNPDGYLFANSADKVMQDSSIGNYIQEHSFKGLGEGRVCKLVLGYYAKRGNIREITRISKSRGTNIQTLIDFYMPHLSAENKD